MTSVDATTETLKQLLIGRIPGIRADEIDPDASLLEDGVGLTSLMLVDFIVSVEEAFGLTFSEEDLSMNTFGCLRALATFIASRQHGSAP